MTEDKRFKRAFVAHSASYDFSILQQECGELIFVTNGYESEHQLWTIVRQKFNDFNPTEDVFVPVGNVRTNVLAGVAISMRCEQLKHSSFSMALFKDKMYHYIEVQLNSKEQA